MNDYVDYIRKILKIAIKKEDDSYILYKDLAEKTLDVEVKRFFQALMQEELQHKKYFEDMLDQILHGQVTNVDKNKAYIEKMQELLEGSRKVAVLSPAQMGNYSVAIDYAIEREKDSVLFYLDMENYLPMLVRAKIDDIIRAENTHVDKLEAFKQRAIK